MGKGFIGTMDTEDSVEQDGCKNGDDGGTGQVSLEGHRNFIGVPQFVMEHFTPLTLDNKTGVVSDWKSLFDSADLMVGW